MKQTINIIAFFFVLAIPFALSSQTRKAIPAGRYEALSGIKNSRTTQSSEALVGVEKKAAASLFWSEVLTHVPEKAVNLNFVLNGKVEEYESTSLLSKGLSLSRNVNNQTKLIYSDNLKRDESILKSLKNKESLVVLKDSHELKDVLNMFSKFDVILYQAETNANYFLLKLK